MGEHVWIQLGELAADNITGKRVGVAAREKLQVQWIHMGFQAQG
jgi:hypothetical protein